MAKQKSYFTKPIAFFRLLRLNRSAMVAMIAGSAAFVAGAGTTYSLWMALTGWFLAIGGFSLDFYADRDLDVTGPRVERRHNPLADGTLSPATGLAFSLTFIIISAVLAFIIEPRSLIPWSIILAILIGLALHKFETPIARALTLGLLQALYAILGGTMGSLSPGLGLLAAMFFFAMFGARGMTDIRDFSQDTASRVNTLPRRYGIKHTARIVAIFLCISYALSLAAYFTGEFNTTYLYLDLVFVIAGIFCAWLFATRPSPKLAYTLTLVCMMGLGSVICAAMILGSM